MVSVLTITAADRDRVLRLAAKVGLSGEISGLIARERDKEVGWLLTGMRNGEIQLLAAETQEDIVLEGLIRTALYSAYDRGILRASCQIPALFPMLERLHFDWECGERRVVSLPEFCHRPCRV